MFEAWRLQHREESAREEELREHIRGLEDGDRKEFYAIYQEQVRDPDTYAVLNWFFLAGLHHFYLGKVLRGMLNLAMMLVGFALLFVVPILGSLLVLLVILVELPALFRSQIVVMHHNTLVGEKLVEKLRGGRGQNAGSAR